MTGKETDIAEARQLIVDLYGCRTSCIDDVDSIKNVIHMVCQCIGAGIVEECYHKFSPMGISAVAPPTFQSTPGLSMGMRQWIYFPARRIYRERYAAFSQSP